MSKVRILGMPQSPFVWAARMAAAEKGIEIDFAPVMPHTPEIDAISPFGKMPVLRHGDVTIAESRAIARYLDELDARVPLMPRDPVAAARAEQWIMHAYCEYTPSLVLRYIVPYAFPSGADGRPDRGAIEAALPALGKAITVLDRQLDGRSWIAGDFSFADIIFAPMLHYAGELPEGGAAIAAAPHVAAWQLRMQARASFKATFPPPLPARAAA
jgi:glutathione S-transferase